MRMMRAIALASIVACAACSEGSQGAVSLRWRLVDLQTGAMYDPRQQQISGVRTDGAPIPQGACGCLPADAGGGCAGAGGGWEVDKVRLRVIDPVTGLDAPVDASLVFPCSSREATTPFIVPAGDYALSIEAFNLLEGLELDGGATGVIDSGVTPAPTIRQVKATEIVNLDVVEIGVHANPLGTPQPPVDMAAPDLGIM